MELTQNQSLFLSVHRFLNERNIESYLVGGFIRDLLLGRDTADIDIVVKGDALEIAREMYLFTGGTYITLDEENRTGRIVIPTGDSERQLNLDISSLKENIQKDLSTRDFTINAMAVNFNQFIGKISCFNDLARALVGIPLIDPYNGQQDLQKGIIRAVTRDVFKEDSLRLLRAIRLSAELDFNIDTETQNWIKEDAIYIKSVAGERVREELLRILNSYNSGYRIKYLEETGILTNLVPELLPLRETTQPPEHYWKVLDHSLNTLVAINFILRQGRWLCPEEGILEQVPWSSAEEQYFNKQVAYGSSIAVLLKIAALLHDIAKPLTKTITEEGKMRFLGHEKEGAIMASHILNRLRFSTREIKMVETFVRYHLRPTQLTQDDIPTDRALYRYCRDTGEGAIAILYLSLADHLATRGPLLDLTLWEQHTKLVKYVLNYIYQKNKEQLKPQGLINGHDLINIFHLKPGPEIKIILEAIREAQAIGEIQNRDEALKYIESKLIHRTGSKT